MCVCFQNKYNLAAETTIPIRVEDVNDNIPGFAEVLSGSVLENEPVGTPVMQVRAIDADATPSHNQVTYELDDNNEYFAIDRYTGNITTKVVFDREQRDIYNVKVSATDNSPSALYKNGLPNKGTYPELISTISGEELLKLFSCSVVIGLFPLFSCRRNLTLVTS